MESTSQSSKVAVEYHDPAGVFSLVSREIAARLPLRNLNWQSPPRPLRQIKSLHIDFVPDKDTQSSLRPDLSRIESSEPASSFDIVRGGSDERKPTVKERRHQIPGFRTSPYLKIYVLRCDDKDKYKEHARREIREWIKESAQSDGKRDQHDAFEWLILHVVIPGTIAASEPRWRESAKDPDELKERKGGNKLIGKSTRTVFDRLRADFNETGKSAHDRVAQIRLTEENVPADLLPTPAVATTLQESAQERENAWNDLIVKFKSLILEPFDRRVRQYEADITEQEARRSMPGWNFCTFFIHKEGLAKALESIGLVEDALAIYDELSLGLENVLRDMAAGQARGTATSFAPYTDDIRQRILGLPDDHTNGANGEANEQNADASELFRKDYRERIVRSDISVFDFLCYLFSRQKTLVLRLANSKSARVQLGADASREGGEDLVLASEVCWRASTFLHNAARALRQDLMEYKSLSKGDAAIVDTEGLVCSWIWAVAGQVLNDTAAPALLDLTKGDGQRRASLANGHPTRPAMSIGLGANTHPQRTTSLPSHRLEARNSQWQKNRPRTQHDDSIVQPVPSVPPDSATPAGIPGQAELATYRAELVLAQRKVLEQVAVRRGWHTGWAVAKEASGLLGNFDTNHVGENDTITSVQVENRVEDLNEPLRNALQSRANFHSTFERLTNNAIRHFYAGTQSKSAETLLGDLGMLKTQQHEFESAVGYFEHILPIVTTGEWKLLGLQALIAYSSCLSQLQRILPYVQTSLTAVARIVSRALERQTLEAERVSNDLADAYRLLQDATEVSAKLEQDVVQPLKHFFNDIHLSREVQHSDDYDGFSLALQLRHIIKHEITFDEISARLVSHQDTTQEVWVTSTEPVALQYGLNTVVLRAKTVAYGPFLIDKIVLRAKKITFVEEVRPPPKPTPLGFTEIEPPTVTVSEPEEMPPFIFLFPGERAFDVELRRSKNVHIDRYRYLELHLDAGQNEIAAVELRIKPTSAGLRLHTADSKTTGIDLAKGQEMEPSQLKLAALNASDSAIVAIPYTVEHRNREISVRLEVHYRTAHGTFAFLKSARLPNELPLDVDVNDVFQLNALFSSFIVRSTSAAPFSVLEAELIDSPLFQVEKPLALPLPLTVYKSQPLKLVYKVTRKQLANNKTLKKDAALSLRVRYQPMDELLLRRMQQSFEHALSNSPFTKYRRLLVPLLLERASSFVRGQNLEMIAFLGESSCPSFEDMSWHEISDSLPSTERQPLMAWLRKWHEDHTIIAVDMIDAEERTVQSIAIAVDVPNIDMVFSASLDLQHLETPARFRPPVVTLGQPLQASVSVRHTDQWSAKKVFPSVPTFSIPGEEAAFVCEIGSDSDAWIIGGQRRYHFTPQDDQDQTVKVTLIPMKVGIHALPHVEVRQESQVPEGASTVPDEPSVSCETHYESAGRSVQVIRNMRTTRVHIAESAASIALPPSRPGTASTKDYG